MQANAAAGRVYGERPGPVIIPWSATVIVPVIERVRNGQPPAIPSETRSVREEAWKFLPAATCSAFFRHASQRVAAPAKRASRHNLELVRVEGVTSKAIPGPTPGGASTDTQPGARARTQSRLAIAPNARLITLTVVGAALRSSQFFQLVPANADATFNIEILAYGVAPVNDRELGAVISAKATLIGRGG